MYFQIEWLAEEDCKERIIQFELLQEIALRNSFLIIRTVLLEVEVSLQSAKQMGCPLTRIVVAHVEEDEMVY